ncbi:vitellogenin-like [Plodia interpunctella]|uniref:vitellogenin-like n=1 Tax=Plodia interpunctella TaxID=58824 RepID=UPI00236887E3|nr:vitellogenin-like [Plodia interpunctella]
MKILVLTAFIAAIALGDPKADVNQSQWPWQVGKLYRYEVVSTNLARLQEGQSSGSVFRARFLIRTVAPGILQAKLEDPQHAILHQDILNIRELPQDLKYKPVPKLDELFEITVQGGRILSLTLPSAFTVPQENLLKGLIGTLQVDLSTYRVMHNVHDQYDKDTYQGQFSKMETDVTGDCKTLYTISPVSSEWRRELTHLQPTSDPIEITKSKNYGHCHHRVAYHFGVPKGSEWTGTAHKSNEEQLVRRSTVSRILAAKQGPIYKAETTSTVQVNPLLFGKQKGEVLSYIQMNLVAFEKDNESVNLNWPKTGRRAVRNLLYSVGSKPIAIHDSSSSSSSSESDEHEYAEINAVNPRVRRSLQKIVDVKRSDEDSSSSSSSSESSDRYVNDDLPTNNEPAYAALYMSPQPRADKKQNPMNVQKLVQDIAQQLQNPSNMPKNDFLAKFSILVRILASMSFEQLSQTSRGMEIAKTANNIVKSDMWMVYRDAIAQTGTLPAFQEIRNWVQTNKIQDEEAAQVIASLGGSLRYPTKEIMVQFFNLAMSDNVRQQPYLNSTALLTATRFINQGQVNNETAHHFYPTHMYGRLARKHDPFVYREILPRLSQELRQAVQQGDSVKAQVFIRAIGNLGHRQILQEFTPYLEGQVPVTTYLRREMINCLDVLAHQHDKLVRTVLFKILKNTAEPYEVRVAAIHNILMARPTPAMMMVMAQMTHTDPAIHVRAALRSSIVYAAQLKNPRYMDLARTALAVKWMLSKEDLGVQYSGKILQDSFSDEYELGIMSALTYTGSRDSLFPNFLKYSLRSKAWNNANTISASFSNVRQFSNYIEEQIRKIYKPSLKSEPNQRFSPEKIAEELNIKRDDQQPFAASFYVDILNQQRYFSFNDYDLQELPRTIAQYFSKLGAGIDKHYTKVLNQAQVSIMFPVATGMPFIYKYKEPTVIHMQGKVQGQVQNEKKLDASATLSKEISFTYARNLDGSLGYMDTLVNQYISAGVVNKLQVNVPVKLELQMKSGQLKITLDPLHPEQDQTILHYSVWPYTAVQMKDSLVTISQDPNTKLITRPHKESVIDTKFGKTLGIVFQFQGYSYSSDYKNVGNLFNSADWLSNIAFASKQKDIALTHYNLRYLAKQSQNKRISLTAVYDGYYNLKEKAQEDSTPAKIEDATPNSEARRQQLVKRVSSGINTAKAQVLDVSASFEGLQPSNYVFTYAMASSLVDTKIQYAFYAVRNSPQEPANNQINGFGKVVKPEIWTMNLLEALNKEMKTMFEANINYGQNGNGHINVQGHTERTKEYVEQIRKHPLTKMCEEEMTHNNLYLDSCMRAVVIAHAPNYIKTSVSYNDLSPAVRSMFYQAYKILEHFGYWYTDVNPMKVTADGKLELETKISYFENKLNLALNTRLGEVRAKNVPIPRMSAGALAIYTPFRTNEIVKNYYTRQQYQPFCTIDYNAVRTFSNRKYQYTLSPSWHVAMHHDGSRVNDKLTVLTRRPSVMQQELYIAYKANNGMHLEMEVQAVPEGSQKYRVNVNTNAKKISEGALTIYYDELEQIPLVQYYTGADGVLQVFMKEDRLRAMFDGQRLVLLSSEERNNNRGICGYMSGSPRYDYLTPYGVVDEPQQYAASYTLKDQSDPKTEQFKVEAQKQAYQLKNKYTVILRTDDEWSDMMHSHSSSSSSKDSTHFKNVYRSRSYLKEDNECQVQQQVQYYENHGEICISNAPVPACQSHCRGTEYKVQYVQVICRPKIDQLYISYRDMIRQGGNPKVDGETQIKHYRVPTSCVA